MTALAFRTEMDFAYGEARELVPGVRRVVARNPGPYTFKGTNTYLVGERDITVIDPGPEDHAHRDAILAAAGERPITQILITHTHRDHIDGLDALIAATGATVMGFGRRDVAMDEALQSPTGRRFIDVDFNPDVRLRDGDRVTGADFALDVIHTPGHALDHLCFALEGTGVLFSGDHVMGWNTTVVAPPEGHMGDYLHSLERLLKRDDTVFLPGHGGRIETPQRTCKAYLIHRRMREQSIVDAVRGGTRTINAIVAAIYDKLDPNLINAAKLSVQAHVEHLMERGIFKPVSELAWDSELSIA